MPNKIVLTTQTMVSLTRFISSQCRFNMNVLELIEQLNLEKNETYSNIIERLNGEIQKQTSLEWSTEFTHDIDE